MLARTALVLAALVVPARAQEQVLITTIDGLSVLGTPSLKRVVLETDFGSAEVRVDRIASITFGDPDVLVTRGELELRGEVTFKIMRLTTDDGEQSFKPKELAGWIAVVDGKRLDVTDFSGEWMSSFGPISLEQSGSRVTGHYGHNRTSVEGKVSGDTLAVTYKGGGEATFTLWEDTQHMVGPWKSGERDGRWGAYRKRAEVATPVPGEIVRGQTESGLWYHLRAPKNYDPSKSYPAICILHGSNMSSADYVGTFPGAWPELTENYIVVGFDGESLSGWSEADSPVYNYSYVNFGGHKVGPAFAHRQSPALVAEGLDQLKAELPIERWLVGGHSQGGFLTYALAMFYPEAMAGVFPMSCNLLVQCDPGNFKDEEIRGQQRRLAFAPIHGENDDVVGFSGGKVCYSSLVDGGFPAARFFTDKRAGHMFALLPVDDAIRWLDDMTAGQGGPLAVQATEAAATGRWRDVGAALLFAKAVSLEPATEARLAQASQAFESAASAPLARLQPAVMANKNGDWVPDFLLFREQFGFSEAGQEVMQAYAKLREQHQKPADDLFWKQRGEQDKDEQESMRRTIVDKYYASSWYEMVKGWLN